MSDKARFWSRNLRGGFNVTEHAIARELAEHHNEETNLCFPNVQTLADIYETGRGNVKRATSRLETWQLMTKVEWFRTESDQSQTSNRYRLHLDRHFPDPPPEPPPTRNKDPKAKPRPYDVRDQRALAGATQGRVFLKEIHHFFRTDQTLAAGIKEAFIEKFVTDTPGQVKRNARLWVSVESETTERKVLEQLPELAAHLRKASSIQVEIELLLLCFRGQKKPLIR